MKRYTFEQFAKTRIYSGAVGYAPDGQTLAHINNASGQFNIWLRQHNGEDRQLTFYTDHNRWFQIIIDFLEEHLLDEPSPA